MSNGNNVTVGEKVTKFLPVIDKLYLRESFTSIFEVDGAIWTGTQSIKVPRVTAQGNVDYDRETGYGAGAIGVTYQTIELTHDRGRKFTIDAVQGDEINFDLLAEAMVTYERNHNIPEIDAIRFAAIATNAGTTVTANLTTPAEALAAYDAAEVSWLAEGRDMSRSVMYLDAHTWGLIKQSLAGSGRINLNVNNGVLNRIVNQLDNTPLIVVPNDRFYSAIELLNDGDGGYQAATGAGVINFLLLEVDVPQAVTKRKADKVIEPKDNQTHDGYAVFYRTFHDIYFFDLQKVRVYAHLKEI